MSFRKEKCRTKKRRIPFQEYGAMFTIVNIYGGSDQANSPQSAREADAL
jgi:hypothetical protein